VNGFFTLFIFLWKYKIIKKEKEERKKRKKDPEMKLGLKMLRS